jgi:hypothetical protein
VEAQPTPTPIPPNVTDGSTAVEIADPTPSRVIARWSSGYDMAAIKAEPSLASAG